MQHACCLTYLHGRSDASFVILKTDDYRIFYPSHPSLGLCSSRRTSTVLEAFLRYLYANRTLVFVGFSFSDPFLKDALQAIHTTIARDDAAHATPCPSSPARLPQIKHYALIQQVQYPDEEERLARSYDESVVDQHDAERARRVKHARELAKLLPSINIEIIPYQEHKDCQKVFSRIRQALKAGKAADVMTASAGKQP